VVVNTEHMLVFGADSRTPKAFRLGLFHSIVGNSYVRLALFSLSLLLVLLCV
jgi:hypothetical protein